MSFEFINRLLPGFSADQALANDLAEHIILGGLKIGEKPSLSDRFGLGVDDLQTHKALKMLESGGVLVRGNTRKLRVSALALSEFLELFLCWTTLQSASVKIFSSRGGFSDVATLDIDPPPIRAGLDAFGAVKLEMRLMNAVAEVAANERMIALLARTEWQLWRYRFHLYQSQPDLLRVCSINLGELFDALQREQLDETVFILEQQANQVLKCGRVAFSPKCLNEA